MNGFFYNIICDFILKAVFEKLVWRRIPTFNPVYVTDVILVYKNVFDIDKETYFKTSIVFKLLFDMYNVFL